MTTFNEAREYLKIVKFIKDKCPNVKNARQKLSHGNRNGYHIDFTTIEKREIKAAFRKFAKELTSCNP